MDKVYYRIQKRFEWPCLKSADEKWISVCLSCEQAKDPRKLRFPLQSIESSEFNEVVQINHRKICMTATGYEGVNEEVADGTGPLDHLSATNEWPGRKTETHIGVHVEGLFLTVHARLG